MNALDGAIYQALTAGTALTSLLAGTAAVYNQAIPRGAPLPCLVFNLQGGGDDNRTPRRVKDLVYQVKAVADSSAKLAGDIDEQAELLLDGRGLTVAGWTAYWAAREGEINYAEVGEDGRYIWHRGGLYRFRLST